MTKTHHMRISLSNEEASIAPFRSEIIFTQEQRSHETPLRPRAIRHYLNTPHCSESRLSTNAPMCGTQVFDRNCSRRSAFFQKLPTTDEASPKYYLPMKRCSSSDVKMVVQRHLTQNHPSTPDTMMSSSESVHSTPQSCHSQFDFSPPNLNHQSPNFMIAHEKSVPSNILLPSL